MLIKNRIFAIRTLRANNVSLKRDFAIRSLRANLVSLKLFEVFPKCKKSQTCLIGFSRITLDYVIYLNSFLLKQFSSY